jgi:hypothetical protein
MSRLGWKSNGFTPRKRAIALEALAEGASRKQAAAAAGVSESAVYNAEKRDSEFASLCRAARGRAGAASLDTLAWQHGVTGIEEEVVQDGKVVGTRRKRSDSVFKMILEGSSTGLYGPAIRALRARIERELRPRIEAELRPCIEAEFQARQPKRLNAREIRKQLEAKLSDFNRRMGGEG